MLNPQVRARRGDAVARFVEPTPTVQEDAMQDSNRMIEDLEDRRMFSITTTEVVKVPGPTDTCWSWARTRPGTRRPDRAQR